MTKTYTKNQEIMQYGSNRKSIDHLSNMVISRGKAGSNDEDSTEFNRLNNSDRPTRMTMDKCHGIPTSDRAYSELNASNSFKLHTFPLSELMSKKNHQERKSGLEDFISNGDIPQVPLIDDTYQSFKEQLKE
jgi:hypothetical protein